MPNYGIMFRCQNPPEQLIETVQRAEQSGYDEVWLVEDCFYAGGLVSASVALASTQTMRIGLGIMPAVARNAAFAAMEVAALARLYPGRFLPGLGHGVAAWMQQIGAFPQSQLAALEEVTVAVRSLLAGEEVTLDGSHVHLDRVKLEFPPDVVPPISLGVRRQKSLRLAGRVADGTILAEYASAAYVEWARGRIAEGQQDAKRSGQAHRVTVFAFIAMDDDRSAALQTLRPLVAAGIAKGRMRVYLEPLGIAEDAERLLAQGGRDHLQRAMPDEWISQLALVGSAEECRAAIQGLVAAGADTVVLVPVADDWQALERMATDLLPLLRER